MIRVAISPSQISLVLTGLALLLGVLTAGSSLSYQPQGRINLLLVWFSWAGLPLVFCLFSLLLYLLKPKPDWAGPVMLLVQKLGRRQNLPSPWLWLQLQWFWLMFGLGLLLCLGFLLLFTDLAFAWSSTLLNAEQLQQLISLLSRPWADIWPQAVPSAELIAQTQYARIDNRPLTSPELFGLWWPFLLASTLVYNLLPRLLWSLWLGFRYWRWQVGQFRVPAPETLPDLPSLQTASHQSVSIRLLCLWRQVQVPEPLAPKARSIELGMASFEQDQRLLAQQAAGGNWCWCVDVQTTPLAELADLIAEMSDNRRQHYLWASQPEGSAEMHRLSWQQFCQQQGLIWLT